MIDNLILSIFAPKEINRVSDYERFRNTKAFIRQQSLNIPDNQRITPALKSLLKRLGYSRFDKFRKNRMEWDNLQRWVPLAYLAAIGADIEIIDYLVRLDQQEYDKALMIPLFPEYAVVRLMAAVYSQQCLPPATPEFEAIEILKKYSGEHGLRCCIKFPDIKTIWIEPDGNVHYSFYRPSFRVTKSWAIFSQDGKDVAVSSIR